jgi:hypothetical protein
LAHELRNPLAPLRSGLETLKRTAPDSEAYDRTVKIMDRQLNMLVHLVDDLLDVGRITSGKIQLRRARVSLQSVLAASAEASRAIIDARTHHLMIDTCEDELVVDGDPDRLVQVFSNLLSNAAKYTDKAGMIEVKLSREGDQAVVTVSDNGIGIPAEDLSSIFGLFAQVRAHHEHAAGGLGIGLSLVKTVGRDAWRLGTRQELRRQPRQHVYCCRCRRSETREIGRISIEEMSGNERGLRFRHHDHHPSILPRSGSWPWRCLLARQRELLESVARPHGDACAGTTACWQPTPTASGKALHGGRQGCPARRRSSVARTGLRAGRSAAFTGGSFLWRRSRADRGAATTTQCQGAGAL